MLLPYDIVADVIALADVVAIYYVVDVVTTDEDVTYSITARWQMLLPYDVVDDETT